MAKKSIWIIAILTTMFLVFGVKFALADTATGRVTISNVPPSVSIVTLFNQDGEDAAVTLTAGSTVDVFCNATLTDYDGYADITSVTATLYHSTSSSGASDDENVHFTNSSCVLGTNTSLIDVPATCYFTLNYMATNGTWTCEITADDGTITGSDTDTNTVDSLAALDVLEPTINFGSMDLGENSSSAQNMTVQNLGNVLIDSRFSGDNYSCTYGIIPVGNTRYDLITGGYDDMSTDLTEDATTQTGFDLGVRGVATADGADSTEGEYWTIMLPSTDIAGTCTNTLTVTAIAG